MTSVDPRPPAAAVAAVAAALLPALLAFNVAPSPTFLNQALAFALWGACAMTVALDVRLAPPSGRSMRSATAPLAVLALVAGSAAMSALFGHLPSPLALSAIGTLAAAAVLLVAGLMVARGPGAAEVFAGFCAAWVIAGLFNAVIAVIQVFAPSWSDSTWIAHSSIPGRAVGNLRQPNHLSSLLLWAAIGVVGLLELRRIGLRWAVTLMAVVVFAVVLTASRTGVVGVVLLAIWAGIDRRLARATRGLLLGAPAVYALGWGLMAMWARMAHATFGGQQRLAEADLSASRFAIWSDTWRLIVENPWTGVGFGEFNFAWSLSVLPHRPTAFFDHSHNLMLQLAAELGLPLTGLLCGLLLWAFWRAIARWRELDEPASTVRRCALAMLVLIGVHSQLEYPLWYSYFLLPASLALGVTVAPAASGESPRREGEGGPRAIVAASALAVILGAVGALADYRRVVDIFAPGEVDAPLAQRIERGQRSVLFAHHADYAAATVAEHPATQLASFERAAHYLIDTRLMMRWSQGLADAGDRPRAVYLAQRLREFRNPQAAEFFAVCGGESPSSIDVATAFQCEKDPPSMLGWRDFRQP